MIDNNGNIKTGGNRCRSGLTTVSIYKQKQLDISLVFFDSV